MTDEPNAYLEIYTIFFKMDIQIMLYLLEVGLIPKFIDNLQNLYPVINFKFSQFLTIYLIINFKIYGD